MSSDESSDSSDSEFNDGYDENLMGDEEDQARLQALSEKERETEIFKRSEQRDALRRRWEIEQKLRQARRAERAKDKSKAPKDKKKKEEKRKRREQEKAEAAAAGTLSKSVIVHLFRFSQNHLQFFASAIYRKESSRRSCRSAEIDFDAAMPA